MMRSPRISLAALALAALAVLFVPSLAATRVPTVPQHAQPRAKSGHRTLHAATRDTGRMLAILALKMS